MTMDTTVAIAAGIDALTVSEGTNTDSGSTSAASIEHASIKEVIRGLTEAIDAITSAQRTLVNVVNQFDDWSSIDAGLVNEQTDRLKDTAKQIRETTVWLRDAAAERIVEHLVSLGDNNAAVGSSGTPSKTLLSYFRGRIGVIVKEIIDKYSDRSVIWRVAKRCCEEAEEGGTLDIDYYFDALDDDKLGGPYDPDYESEQYYEHEDRLQVDDEYAAAFQMNAEIEEEQNSQARHADRKCWIDFLKSLRGRIPTGTTLFFPLHHLQEETSLIDVPRYLFRAFDKASMGINNEHVIASTASQTGSKHSSIFTLDDQKAMNNLFTHLKGNHFAWSKDNNLVSWTSSLLFAVQRAIYRAHTTSRPVSEMKICAIDTRKFPKGQFIRDIPLLKAYHTTANDAGGPKSKFFNFRLTTEDFHNGEHLSQGTLHHAGRSCMMSLQKLIEAGLFELYPEFKASRGRNEWAYRVLDLRRAWSAEYVTTDREIKLALEIGRECFTAFDLCDIASMLLTFKNRHFSNLENFDLASFSRKPKPSWADRPVEVSRYWNASERIESVADPESFERLILRAVFSARHPITSTGWKSSTITLCNSCCSEL